MRRKERRKEGEEGKEKPLFLTSSPFHLSVCLSVCPFVCNVCPPSVVVLWMSLQLALGEWKYIWSQVTPVEITPFSHIRSMRQNSKQHPTKPDRQDSSEPFSSKTHGGLSVCLYPFYPRILDTGFNPFLVGYCVCVSYTACCASFFQSGSWSFIFVYGQIRSDCIE